MERHHLKRAALRGGIAKIGSHAANVLIRIVSLMIFARLLDPTDFGLIGMVVAVTGALALLKDFGLSAATVQRASISESQLSALFWFNCLLGAVVWLVCIAAAPILAWFYHEDRLVWITIVLTSSFFFTAASVQHNALLQRQMRFGTLALVDIIALVGSAVIGIVMAALGLGYWALVGWSLALPVITCLGVWIAAGWVPQTPRRDASVRPMLHFGGLVTLNILVVQVAYNLDKVLVGRFWGAEILGLYGRANQLTTMATDNLLSAVGTVAFPALSRVQGDSEYLENFFLKGYKITLTMSFPIAVACALFAEDIVAVLLGARWISVAPLLQLSSPLIVIFALISPTGWFLYALGRVARSLKMALVILPVVTIGYVAGLPYGAAGVAAGYSIAMALWVFPHLVWCTRETMLTPWRMLAVAKTPTVASLVAAAVSFGVHLVLSDAPPLLRLLCDGIVLSLAYMFVLLWARAERAFYIDLIRSLRAGSSEIESSPAGVA